MAKPQHYGSWRTPKTRPRAESDTNHTRCRGAKSFVDDLGLSRGVVLSRAVHFCDLLRLSPLTRRFVRFRRTRLRLFFFFPLEFTCGLQSRWRFRRFWHADFGVRDSPKLASAVAETGVSRQRKKGLARARARVRVRVSTNTRSPSHRRE